MDRYKEILKHVDSNLLPYTNMTYCYDITVDYTEKELICIGYSYDLDINIIQVYDLDTMDCKRTNKLDKTFDTVNEDDGILIDKTNFPENTLTTSGCNCLNVGHIVITDTDDKYHIYSDNMNWGYNYLVKNTKDFVKGVNNKILVVDFNCDLYYIYNNVLHELSTDRYDKPNIIQTLGRYSLSVDNIKTRPSPNRYAMTIHPEWLKHGKDDR